MNADDAETRESLLFSPILHAATSPDEQETFCYTPGTLRSGEAGLSPRGLPGV